MEEVEDTIKRFRANGGIIIQSIKFAESYELWPAHYMYMLGYDYNPEQNAQAEDRIHRDKAVTPDPVDIYYTIAEGAYDERVLDELAFNADNVWALLDKPASQLADLFGR